MLTTWTATHSHPTAHPQTNFLFLHSFVHHPSLAPPILQLAFSLRHILRPYRFVLSGTVPFYLLNQSKSLKNSPFLASSPLSPPKRPPSHTHIDPHPKLVPDIHRQHQLAHLSFSPFRSSQPTLLFFSFSPESLMLFFFQGPCPGLCGRADSPDKDMHSSQKQRISELCLSVCLSYSSPKSFFFVSTCAIDTSVCPLLWHRKAGRTFSISLKTFALINQHGNKFVSPDSYIKDVS